MPIVTPHIPVNLFVQPTSQPLQTSELRQLDLRLEQIVRATVVEGGLDKAVLEMNHRQYRAEADKQLQVGQQLKLQVMQVQPRLEFRVLNDPLADRLAALLPLLTRSYDWARLLDGLPSTPGADRQQAEAKMLQALQQLLQPAGRVRQEDAAIVGLIRQVLRQLPQPEGTPAPLPVGFGAGTTVPYQPPAFNSPGFVSALDKLVADLLQGFQRQLEPLPQRQGAGDPRQWLAETRTLLSVLQKHDAVFFTQLSVSIRQQLEHALLQVYDHPRTTPQLAAEVKAVLLQIEGPATREILPETQPAAGGRTLPGQALSATAATTIKHDAVAVASEPRPLPAGAQTNDKNAEVVAVELQKLNAELGRAVEQKSTLPPETLGRLEGLLSRLQQLTQDKQAVPAILANLETALGRLTRFTDHPAGLPRAEHLGVLSQLFGLYLEAELLRGKEHRTLANLKLSLLQLQEDAGKDVAEPLRRLELFQLCKARLAEEQIQFLPLPFPELEEGYLLAGQQKAKPAGAQEEPLHLSLSLRLSALGNVRVDMVYSQRGLDLHIAGENREKMDYLEEARDEFAQAIATIAVRNISFAADAQLPAKQLQERLLPQLAGILDARA